MAPLLDDPRFGPTPGLDSLNQNTKVLLVEDNPSDALLVRSALLGLRERELQAPIFDIRSATRLALATDCLAKESFDVILLDLSLPDSQSLEQSFSHIHKCAPDVPIIVLTGLGGEDLGLKMIRNGAQDYLIKSRVERYVLVKAIRYAIERQRAEQALRKSEEDFRSIVETTREWIWSMDLSGNLTYSNPAVESILGYTSEELLYKPAGQLLDPQACELFRTQMEDAAQSNRGWSDLTLRWRHKNGGYRWLQSNSAPMYSADRKLIGFRGSDRDITERELAKVAHTELQLKLVTVQEEQRHRIARELHDQLGQAIAALMLGLKSLAHSYEPKEQARVQLQQLQSIANDLARDVHSLAVDLRPTALDDLGLEVALANYVEAWTNRWQIPADFHSNGFTNQRLASHIETIIYRIAQEALSNVVRHATAATVSLILERADDRVGLIIEDDGCGFEVETVMKAPAKEQRIGLLGMEERVALVGGSLTIESTPGMGTSVYVRIPISLQTNGELAQWTN